MITLKIAYYKFIRNWRDKTNLILLFIFPLLIIYILGNALSGIFSSSSKSKDISNIEVVLINKDKGEMAKGFEDYLARQEISKVISVNKSYNEKEAVELLKKGNICSIIEISGDFTDKIRRGEKVNINIIENNSKDYKSDVVKSVVESYINGMNTVKGIFEVKRDGFDYKYINVVENISLSKNNKIPRAIDYYAVTMLIMTIMYGSIIAFNSIAEGYLSNTVQRLKVANVKSFSIFMGTLIGDLFWMFIDSIIIIIITKFLYNANWGENYIILLTIIFLACTFSLGMGIFMYMVMRNIKAGEAILQSFIIYSTFISGGYNKLNLDGTTLEKFQYTSPNYISQKAIFNLIYGNNLSITINYMIVLLVLIFIILLFSSFLDGCRIRFYKNVDNF